VKWQDSVERTILTIQPSSTTARSTLTSLKRGTNSVKEWEVADGDTRTGGECGSLACADFRYVFDHVFRMDATQEEVYENTAQPLLEGVLNGYNATVFAYGVS
jgi:hypothetical protein